MANKLVFFLSHHIFVMINGKDSAEDATRLDTKCLMWLENIGGSSNCNVKCCSTKGMAGIQQSMAEYLPVEVFCSLCVLKCYLYWVEMCHFGFWFKRAIADIVGNSIFLLQGRELPVFSSHVCDGKYQKEGKCQK